jgi:hypothetical protein
MSITRTRKRFPVLISIAEHIPPTRNEYPICINTDAGDAPTKRFVRCTNPKAADEIIIERKISFVVFLLYFSTSINTQPLNASSSKRPTPRHITPKRMISAAVASMYVSPRK